MHSTLGADMLNTMHHRVFLFVHPQCGSMATLSNMYCERWFCQLHILHSHGETRLCQGIRNNFEDCHMLDQERGICGIFDGHLGDEAAAFCAERLHLHVTAGDKASLTKAFGDCDDALRKVLPKSSEAGTTATIARIVENGNHGGDSVNLVVASCGDSRAILWRRATQSLEVTNDHRPSNPEEQQRIEAAGGSVSEANPEL